METPDTLICDECDAIAIVDMVLGEREGKPQFVPHIILREDGAYQVINCPNCGKREQCMTPPCEPLV